MDPEDDAWASFGVAPRRRLTNAQPNCFEYAQRAPTTKELLATLPAHNLRHTLYRDPFYSNPLDAPTSVYENQVSKLRIDLRGGIGEWNDGVVWRNRDFQLHGRGVHGWEYAGAVAPRRGKIRRWLQKEADEGGPATRSSTSSQQLYFRSQVCGGHDGAARGLLISSRRSRARHRSRNHSRTGLRGCATAATCRCSRSRSSVGAPVGAVAWS